MLILAMDTSTSSGSLAVLKDTETLAELALEGREDYSTRLFRDLGVLLEKCHISLTQIELYAVATGPGTFTGLRVGLAAVKGWAEVHSKPIAAVSTLEAVAAAGPVQASLLAPILDARRGQVFAGLYARQNGRLRAATEDRVSLLGEYLDWLSGLALESPPVFVTPTPDLVRAFLPSGSTVVSASPILAPAVGRLGLLRAQSGELVTSMTLDANYVRRSDAEILWKG
jgi:tRNA threonylcarbamoyladenosine biosynthesis protein TsaB